METMADTSTKSTVLPAHLSHGLKMVSRAGSGELAEGHFTWGVRLIPDTTQLMMSCSALWRLSSSDLKENSSCLGVSTDFRHLSGGFIFGHIERRGKTQNSSTCFS